MLRFCFMCSSLALLLSPAFCSFVKRLSFPINCNQSFRYTQLTTQTQYTHTHRTAGWICVFSACVLDSVSILDKLMLCPLHSFHSNTHVPSLLSTYTKIVCDARTISGKTYTEHWAATHTHTQSLANTPNKSLPDSLRSLSPIRRGALTIPQFYPSYVRAGVCVPVWVGATIACKKKSILRSVFAVSPSIHKHSQIDRTIWFPIPFGFDSLMFSVLNVFFALQIRRYYWFLGDLCSDSLEKVFANCCIKMFGIFMRE